MRTFLLATAAVALAATPAAAAAADLAVSNAWVRLPAVAGRPAAGYFTITGGTQPQAVVGASSPSAKKAELHESRMAGGTMRMTPLARLVVGKGETTMFAPGGKHVMLFGLDPKVKTGGSVRIDLKMADGSTASANAKVVGAADAPPVGGDAPMGHQHHH